ncbi:hypothetical protein BC833DRAFT_569889 [Globomyces pollinis-pini]|nr:hypothetical protein BC833DRAFT_569889 [Globomyces pollinis-pini]
MWKIEKSLELFVELKSPLGYPEAHRLGLIVVCLSAGTFPFLPELNVLSELVESLLVSTQKLSIFISFLNVDRFSSYWDVSRDEFRKQGILSSVALRFSFDEFFDCKLGLNRFLKSSLLA